jgi:hypothetical protein
VARAPARQPIHNWDDLVCTFVGNFHGTYVRPGNSWDLRSCTQKPDKQVLPLGQIDLPVWFGTAKNFCKEMLTFEVVGFKGAYHAILGRPCYAKFMAVPNYTYLKMKMPGPNGIITVGSSIEHAFDCDVECVEHAEALALDEALVTTSEKMVNEDLDSTAKHTGTFEAAEQTKEVPLDPAAPEGKVLRVSSTLDPK